jgi:hypothetical protein
MWRGSTRLMYPKVSGMSLLEQELQMVQLSGTRCSCIAILWASLVSFAAITLCVASQRVFYFVIDSVRKLLDIPSYMLPTKQAAVTSYNCTQEVPSSYLNRDTICTLLRLYVAFSPHSIRQSAKAAPPPHPGSLPIYNSKVSSHLTWRCLYVQLKPLYLKTKTWTTIKNNSLRIMWVICDIWGSLHPEDGGSMVLRNVGNLLQNYMASQPRRRLGSGYSIWESSIMCIKKSFFLFIWIQIRSQPGNKLASPFI